MKKRDRLLLQAAGLGVLAGMRATAPAAILSRHFCDHPSKKLRKSGLSWICTERALLITGVMALGELVADKVTTKDRISPPGLIGRAAAGALAGAVLDKATGGKRPVLVVVGALAALGSSYLSFFGRRALAKKVPPMAAALVEDSIVYSAGACIL